MKITSSVAFSLLVWGTATRAFTLAGELTEAGVAFPKGFPESAATNIEAVLRGPNFRFLAGHCLNSSTTLEYGGDTRSLNLFLKELARDGWQFRAIIPGAGEGGVIFERKR